MIIGELKCQLFPSKPTEKNKYYQTLKEAGGQIQRKADALKANWESFWRDTLKKAPPANAKVVPFVMSNIPLGIGYKFGGVPVIDELIVERFLGEGCLQKFVTTVGVDIESVGETVVFYDSELAAESAVAGYLADPPQMAHFKDGLHIQWNVVPSLGENDKPWYIGDYDVTIDNAKFPILGPLEAPAISDSNT